MQFNNQNKRTPRAPQKFENLFLCGVKDDIPTTGRNIWSLLGAIAPPRRAKAYWALLHYIIIFPDICGALEIINEEASGNSYKDWARRYVEDNNLSAAEWYDIRCSLLHQGRTVGRRRYTLYKFGQPGTIIHKQADPQECSIGLDVSQMADEIERK
jgi:hypothetical protein